MNTLVVVGSGGCGKSALSIRFVAGQFCDEYDPTIEDLYRKTYTVDGETEQLEIIDTAGQEELSSMRATWYSKASAFLLCFSLVDKATLEEAACFRDEILRVAEAYSDCVDPVIVLCGTKHDLLRDQMDKSISQTAVATAKRWGCSYLETSAKEGHNVQFAFEQILRDIRTRRIVDQEGCSAKKSSKKPSTSKISKACSLL